jgi:hypothetical protein
VFDGQDLQLAVYCPGYLGYSDGSEGNDSQVRLQRSTVMAKTAEVVRSVIERSEVNESLYLP